MIDTAILNDKQNQSLESAQITDSADAPVAIKVEVVREIAVSLLKEVDLLFQTATESDHHSLKEHVRIFETELIKRALSKTGGNQTQAARLLGLKLTTLNSKIKRYKIQPIQGAFRESQLRRAV